MLPRQRSLNSLTSQTFSEAFERVWLTRLHTNTMQCSSADTQQSSQYISAVNMHTHRVINMHKSSPLGAHTHPSSIPVCTLLTTAVGDTHILCHIVTLWNSSLKMVALETLPLPQLQGVQVGRPVAMLSISTRQPPEVGVG